MIQLLKSIVDSIVAVANFVWHTIASLFLFIKNIPIYLTFIFDSFLLP